MKSKSALNTVILDLQDISSFTDFFIICSGESLVQVKAIADHVIMEMKKCGELPYTVEGYRECKWILIDYGDIIVNIFYKDVRDYYDLESLWGDVAVVKDYKYEDVLVKQESES